MELSPPVLRTVFTTAEVPPAERLESFDRFNATSYCPMRVVCPEPQDFRATVRAAYLGPLEITEATTASATIARTPMLVRTADPDMYAVIIPLEGRMRLTQAGRTAELRPGWMAVRSSGRPFELELTAEGGPARFVRVQVPRALLTQPVDDLERLLATPISGLHGVGRLFTWLVCDLATGSADGREEHYLPSDLLRLGNVVVEMLGAVLAHEQARGTVAGRRNVLAAQVASFIAENLDDPELSPETIAEAHHISVSYLHRLFEGRDQSVAATIRTERLDRARRDLTDPRLADLPIHRVAARWGFGSHTSFTRAFRARFGVPPQAFRDRLVAGGVPPGYSCEGRSGADGDGPTSGP